MPFFEKCDKVPFIKLGPSGPDEYFWINKENEREEMTIEDANQILRGFDAYSTQGRTSPTPPAIFEEKSNGAQTIFLCGRGEFLASYPFFEDGDMDIEDIIKNIFDDINAIEQTAIPVFGHDYNTGFMYQTPKGNLAFVCTMYSVPDALYKELGIKMEYEERGSNAIISLYNADEKISENTLANMDTESTLSYFLYKIQTKNLLGKMQDNSIPVVFEVHPPEPYLALKDSIKLTQSVPPFIFYNEKLPKVFESQTRVYVAEVNLGSDMKIENVYEVDGKIERALKNMRDVLVFDITPKISRGYPTVDKGFEITPKTFIDGEENTGITKEGETIEDVFNKMKFNTIVDFLAAADKNKRMDNVFGFEDEQEQAKLIAEAMVSKSLCIRRIENFMDNKQEEEKSV